MHKNLIQFLKRLDRELKDSKKLLQIKKLSSSFSKGKYIIFISNHKKNLNKCVMCDVEIGKRV